MADWRERGFVPDSDDEEDDLSLEARSIDGNTSQEPDPQNVAAFATETGSSQPSSGRCDQHNSRLPASSLILGAASSPAVDKPTSSEAPSTTQTNGPWLQRPSYEATQSHSSPTAIRLEQEIQRGLDTCRDVLRSSRELPDDEFDEPDSPLSSLPSSPDASPVGKSNAVSPLKSISHTATPITNTADLTSDEDSSLPGSVEHIQYGDIGALSLPAPAAVSERNEPPKPNITSGSTDAPLPAAVQQLRGGLTRSLRQRAPMQLHPYSLEAAKYQADWKQRGLRPIRTAFNQTPQQRPMGEGRDESQGSLAFSSDQEDSSESLPTSAIAAPAAEDDESQSPRLQRLPVPRRDTIEAEPADDDDDDASVHTDDELPDIDDIFGGTNNVGGVNRPARANGPVQPTRQRKAVSREQSFPAQPPQTTSKNHSSSIYDLPPSPPRSRSLSASSSLPIDYVPPEPSPKPLPTPVVSSESRPTKRRIIDVSSSSEDEESAPDEEESQAVVPAFLQMRRKIKGVLPASWIKLDARQQKQPVERQALHKSPEKQPAKGVARPVSGHARSPTIRTPLVFEYSSESEEDRDGHAALRRPEQIQSDIQTSLEIADDDIVMDDVVEEDTVDHMAPLGPKRTTAKPRKKRQQRLSDSWNLIAPGSKRSTSSLPGVGSRYRQQKSAGSSRNRHAKRLRRSEPARFTILDAPSIISQNNGVQPRYLRVAARSRRPGQMPKAQNPRQKFFELDTAEDTADINTSLYDWTGTQIDRDFRPRGDKAAVQRAERETEDPFITGSLRQPHKKRFHNHKAIAYSAPRRQENLHLLPARSPGRPHSNSRLGEPDDPSDTVRLLKASTNNTLAGLHRQPIRQDIRSGDTFENTNSSNHRLRAGFVSWHQNRAGGGTFWNSKSFSRPTQLETRAIDHRTHRRVPRPLATAQLPTSDAVTPVADSTEIPTPTASKRARKAKTPHQRNVHPVQAISGHNSTAMARFLVSSLASQQVVSHRSTTIVRDPRPLRLFNFPEDGTMLGWPCIIDTTEQLRVTSSPSQGVQVSSLVSRADLEMLEGVQNVEDLIVEELTQLLITSHHASKVNITRSTSGHELSALEAYQRCLAVLLRCLLQPAAIEALVIFGQVFDTHFVQGTSAVIEAWIAVSTTMRSPPPNASVNMNSMLSEQFHKVFPRNKWSSWERLYYLVRFIAGFEMISRIDVHGTFHRKHAINFDPWPLFGSVLKDSFENQNVQRESLPSLAHIGTSASRLCLWLVENSRFKIPDSHVQLMFRQYGKNDMLDMFVPGSISAATKRINMNWGCKSGPNNLTDFEAYLRVVALFLQRKVTEIEDEVNRDPFVETIQKRKSKMLGLVFSLTPNNSRVMDEHNELEASMIVSMANTYALYVVLYANMPRDCRPRPEQVENLVQFATTHARIRDLAIAAWSSMSTAAIEKGSTEFDHQSLGRQGKSMWSALEDKLVPVLQNDLQAGSHSDQMLPVRNCIPVISQLIAIIRQWSSLIDSVAEISTMALYVGEAEIMRAVEFVFILNRYLKSLSTSSRAAYHKLKKFCVEAGPEGAVMELLHIVYVSDSPSTQQPIFRNARRLITHVVSSDQDNDSILKEAVDSWFSIAQHDVGANYMNWDDYLCPPSSRTFRMLADTQLSEQCAVLFLSKIVAEAPDYIALDPESHYQSWVRAILQPRHLQRFDHILTQQIVKNNPSSLDLAPINALIEDETGPDHPLTLEVFWHLRTDIVKLLIRSIFALQFTGPDDSQDLIEDPMDEGVGLRLLQVINEFMKEAWKISSIEQRCADYTSFVQAIIREMEVYKYPGFTLDPWYTDPQRTEFPIGNDRFKQIFKQRPARSSGIIDRDLITVFRQHNQKAANTQDQGQWIQTMVEALSCNNVFEDINNDGSLVMDSNLQIQFVQNVLSVYIERAFVMGPHHAIWVIPIVHILLDLCRNLHFRQDLEEPGKAQSLSNMCLQILHSAHEALEALAHRNMRRKRHTLMLAVQIIRLATLCIERLRQFRAMHPEIDALQDNLDSISATAREIFVWITDPMFATQPDNILAGGSSVPLVMHGMGHLAWSDAKNPVQGTDAGLRELTLKDIDEALQSAHPPFGLSSDWTYWHLGNCASWTGWEEIVERGDELAELANAAKEFGAVASVGADLEVEGMEWRVWERLAAGGPRVVPAEETWVVEEECVVSAGEWEGEWEE